MERPTRLRPGRATPWRASNVQPAFARDGLRRGERPTSNPPSPGWIERSALDANNWAAKP